MDLQTVIWITCRDYENYLPDALYSAHTQTVPCVVVVAHDACGERYPVGLSANRNKLLKTQLPSICRYVVFLDADDILLPDYVENLLTTAGHDTNCVVTCRAQMFGESTGEVIPNMPVTMHNLLTDNSIHCSALVPIRLLQSVGGYDESLLAWEDWEMWLRLCSGGVKFRYCDTTHLLYRRHSDSMNYRMGHTMDSTREAFRVKYGGLGR